MRELAGFLVSRMLLAETAVLAHFDTVRIVALILHRIVIALLALRACHRDLHANTSSSHTRHLLFRNAGQIMPAKHASLLYTKCRYLSTRFFQIFLITGHDLPLSPVFSRFLVLTLKKLKNNSKIQVVR